MHTTERKVYISADSLRQALQATADVVGDGDLIVELRLERREEPTRYRIVLVERIEVETRKARHYTQRERWLWEIGALEAELDNLNRHHAAIELRLQKLREQVGQSERAAP